MWRKIAKCYPPQLELVPLVLLIYAFQVVMSHYSSLPESVPSHFGTSGLPDEWAGKSTLLLFPVIGLVVYLMFSGLNVLFALVRNPRSFINLPEKQKARLTDADAEGLRVFLCRTMFAMKVIIVGMMAYMAYATIEVALGSADSLGQWFYLFLAGIGVVTLLILWRVLRLLRQPGKS